MTTRSSPTQRTFAPSSLLCAESTYGMASTERGSPQPDSTADDWDNSEFLASMSLWDESDKARKHERKQSCVHDRRGWRHAIRTAAQQGDVAEAQRLLATECACPPHEADARTAKERALLNACVYGHTDLLRLLLAHGVNVDAQLENGMTGLLYAAARNHVQCLEVLLDHGADLHHVDTCDSTALHWAADKGAAECVRVLLERGANPTLKGYYGYTPLYCAAKGCPLFDLRRPYSQVKRSRSIDYLECVHILCRPEYITSVAEKEKNDALRAAIENGNVKITQYLLDENIADLSYKTIDGETVMHVAAYCSNVESMRALLKAGVDVNCRENKGRTPLHLVGTSVCAQELISWGADVLAQDIDGWAAVHFAACCGNDDEIRALVAAGADVTVKTNAGESTLHLSAERNTLACLTMLLEMGADMNATTAEGKTPLHCAAQGWSTSCMEKLVSEGADVFARDSQGWTALHWAAREGWIEGCRYLLARGLDVEVRTAAGQTPLHVAVREGNARCVEELLRLHAPVNARDEQGRTPLHVAARGSDEHVAHVLLQGGADRRARDAQGYVPSDLALAAFMERLLRPCLAQPA